MKDWGRYLFWPSNLAFAKKRKRLLRIEREMFNRAKMRKNQKRGHNVGWARDNSSKIGLTIERLTNVVAIIWESFAFFWVSFVPAEKASDQLATFQTQQIKTDPQKRENQFSRPEEIFGTSQETFSWKKIFIFMSQRHITLRKVA